MREYDSNRRAWKNGLGKSSQCGRAEGRLGRGRKGTSAGAVVSDADARGGLASGNLKDRKYEKNWSAGGRPLLLQLLQLSAAFLWSFRISALNAIVHSGRVQPGGSRLHVRDNARQDSARSYYGCAARPSLIRPCGAAVCSVTTNIWLPRIVTLPTNNSSASVPRTYICYYIILL